MIRWRSRNGSLLIIALWLIGIMSLVAVAITRHLSREIQIMRYRKLRVQAAAYARAGLYVAMALLDADETVDYDWWGDPWAKAREHTVDEALHLKLSVADASGHLNLNTATPEQVELLTPSLDIAQAITDYLDSPDETEPNTEWIPPYYPKDGPMAVMEELREIPLLQEQPEGIDTIEKLAVTLPADAPHPLNINTASAEVLTAAAGVDEFGDTFAVLADTLVAARPGSNGTLGDEDDCKATRPQEIAVELAACAALDSEEIAAFLTTAEYGLISSVLQMTVQVSMTEPAFSHTVQALIARPNEENTAATVLTWEEY